eukprot:scaffold7053_cov380-Pinguiococcus_pyrenoidosus.AAC.4
MEVSFIPSLEDEYPPVATLLLDSGLFRSSGNMAPTAGAAVHSLRFPRAVADEIARQLLAAVEGCIPSPR